MEKRTLVELNSQQKPRNAAELETLSEWYFGKALHLHELSVQYIDHKGAAGHARYAVAEKYTDYHGNDWLHSKCSIEGYDYSARFWEFVIGELICGGIASYSYGAARIKEAEDVERLYYFGGVNG